LRKYAGQLVYLYTPIYRNMKIYKILYISVCFSALLASCGTSRKNQHSQQITAKLTSETATTATQGRKVDSSGVAVTNTVAVKKESEIARESVVIEFSQDSGKSEPVVIDLDPYQGRDLTAGHPDVPQRKITIPSNRVKSVTYIGTRDRKGVDSSAISKMEISHKTGSDTTATTATAKTEAETKSVVKDKQVERKGVGAVKTVLVLLYLLLGIAFAIWRVWLAIKRDGWRV